MYRVNINAYQYKVLQYIFINSRSINNINMEKLTQQSFIGTEKLKFTCINSILKLNFL